MMLQSFMEPRELDQTLEEAKASIEGFARMGFGLT
jgi:hypothetical protein